MSHSSTGHALQTDVVIAAHNPGRLLASAVDSAIAQASTEHVWVIDAGGTDGSVEKVRDTYPAVQVVSTHNRGFAAACNYGIREGRAPFVLLLNPDARLLPGALAALESTAESNPKAGIVGALVVNPDHSVQANSYGRFPSLTTSLSLQLWRITQRLRGNRALSPGTPAGTSSVDWVTGAAMLARRETIAQVGPLDEGYFLYYEDIDWCWRMRAAGWEVLLEPEAQVVHHLGGSEAPSATVAQAYRDSFYRYCDLRGLRGLKAVSRAALTLRRLMGGQS